MSIDESEVLDPDVASRIVQAVLISTDPSHHLITLGGIAEGTCPGVIVNVMRTLSIWRRNQGSDATRDILQPAFGRNDVVDLESAECWQQTVLASIARPKAHGKPHKLSALIVPRLPRRPLEDWLG